MAIAPIHGDTASAGTSSAVINMTAFAPAVSLNVILKLSNLGSNPICFQLLSTSGTITFGGAGKFILGPGETDELNFENARFLHHICTTAATDFAYNLVYRREAV